MGKELYIGVGLTNAEAYENRSRVHVDLHLYTHMDAYYTVSELFASMRALMTDERVDDTLIILSSALPILLDHQRGSTWPCVVYIRYD